MEASIQRVQAAVVDGRARTPRYIQKQLTLLHDTLVRSASSIHQAIIRDTGCSSAESWFEIYLALKAVKQEFNALNFQDFIKQEYSLADGKDNASNRIAYGCAYIIPSQHSRFYSTVQPIAAAIAAGNCVIVEMQKTLLEVDGALKKVLLPVLDRDTFSIVEQRPTSDKFFTEQVVVLDNSGDNLSNQFSKAQVLQTLTTRTVAIVDRSADIVDAAKHIVRARFRFSGKSPYAPDFVLVNEFALKEFCQAAARHLTDELSQSIIANGHTKSQSMGSSLQKELQQANTTILVSGARGSIHLLRQRKDSILNHKISEPLLVITPVSSLDDAIDTANDSGSLLATYLFADPAATKYLSQFVLSDVSYTNQIPAQLLVGPIAPRGFPISLNCRLTKEMFSTPSPEYITSTLQDKALSEFLDTTNPSNAAISKLKSEIQAPLPSMGESMTTTIGFFEQGIITGMGVELSLLVAVMGTCAWYAVPALMRRVRG